MAFKIYTKTGDKGTTSLIGGTKVSKAHIRLEAYGSIDELNAHLGLCKDLIQDTVAIQTLTVIQNNLFSIGSILACDPQKKIQLPIPQLEETDLTLLEKCIDEMEAQLQPLKHFIIPGGNSIVSQFHIARCVCRRAERCIAQLTDGGEIIDTLVLKYVNRLSDYLFVLGRYIGHLLHATEIYWKPNG